MKDQDPPWTRGVLDVSTGRRMNADTKTQPVPVMSYNKLCGHNNYVVLFTLNRSFYPTTSAAPPVSFPIHPREIQILWPQTVVRQRKTKRR